MRRATLPPPAYLHPLAQASQVRHILRAAAHAARAAELAADSDPRVADQRIEQARQRATPVLVDVPGRYPLAPAGRSRLAQLMTTVDSALRALRWSGRPGSRGRRTGGVVRPLRP